MPDRICPACNAVVPPRLKFCRECGGRVDDAPAGAPEPEAVSAPVDAGDATMMAAAPRKPEAAATTKLPAPGPSGDATMIGAFTVRTVEPEAMTMAPDPEPPTMAPGRDPEPEALTMAPNMEPEAATVAPGELDLGRTMAPEPEAPPPPAKPTVPLPAAGGDATILGALPTPAPAPAPAEPPPPPPPPAPVEEPEPEPEPITDDSDVQDDSVATLMTEPPPPPPPPVPLPPARAPAKASPPAVPLPPGKEIRLEHWSPKVKASAVTLTRTETVVGRDRGEIQYPADSFLSKKHARFYTDAEGRLCVEDLGALNGTFLRLRAAVKLEHRDVLFLGRHAFRFELLQYEDQDDRTIEGDPLTRVQGVQGKAPRARLVKRQAEGFRGLPFYFGVQRYVIGRTDGTHNFQKDDLMSRKHASLEFKDGDFWLEDLGSQNGTFLRLRGPRPLEPGDVVMMGDQYFRLP